MMKKLFTKASKIYHQKFPSAGITDIIVIQHSSKEYKSTPFSLNFGRVKDPHKARITLNVNGRNLGSGGFGVDQLGYLDPIIPRQEIFEKMGLKKGRNDISFILETQDKYQRQRTKQLAAQIYLYSQTDKLIVSDVDGTLTKSDFYGMVNNIISRNHIHNGYIQFVEDAYANGYQIVWLTMRSISMYKLSKNYISLHTKTPGPLLPWPEQILSALKKQLTKNTIDPKTFLLRNIRQAFPEGVNPFTGALGNRENDALAYTAVEVPHDRIFLVNAASIVQRWGMHQEISYSHMSEEIDHFFPKLQPMKEKKEEQPEQKKSFLQNKLSIDSTSTNVSKSTSINSIDSDPYHSHREIDLKNEPPKSKTKMQNNN